MKRRAPATKARSRGVARRAAVKSGAAGEASITALDALPSRLAVLDRFGRVLVVNRAWTDFAQSSASPADKAIVGDNYIECCAGAAQLPHAAELAAGVRAVLSGDRPAFALEYPIAGSSGRWFHARVTRCANGSTACVVISHDEISERVRLEREIVSASAREQQRFRQDLHDGLSQQLTGLKFKASLLEYHLQAKGLEEAAEAKSLSELLNEATDEASQLARRMRPVEVDARGLMMALRELAMSTEHAHEVTCTVLIRRAVFIHDNNSATNLFRIAQEAVSNAVTEGKARRIQIALSEDNARVTLAVRDNGRALKDRDLEGLSSHIMRYHARMIGGTLEWREDKPRGVVLTCCFQKVPLKRSVEFGSD